MGGKSGLITVGLDEVKEVELDVLDYYEYRGMNGAPDGRSELAPRKYLAAQGA